MDKSDTADTEKNIDELSVRKYHVNSSFFSRFHVFSSFQLALFPSV